MHRFIVVVALVGSLGPAMVGAQPPDAGPIVQVGVFLVLSGGAGSGGAFTSGRRAGDALKGTVYTAQCSVGGGGQSLPVQARYAWRIDGRVESLTADEAVIQLDWQRILAAGQPVTSPTGSIRQTLHNGERLTLDSVSDPARCGQAEPASETFEVRFGSAGSGRRPEGIGRASGAPAGPGGGTVVTRGGGRGDGFREVPFGGGGSGHGTGGGMSSGSTATPRAAFDVDLWLVHGAPNREDEVMHQVLKIAETPIPFQFAPVKIALSQADLMVVILGSVHINTAIETNKQFVFAADRRITFTPRDRPARDPAPEAHGGTKMTDAIPGPDEVVSFEMPTLRVPDGGPAVADRFAIRIRITPVKSK